jgi:hypothetical protein
MDAAWPSGLGGHEHGRTLLSFGPDYLHGATAHSSTMAQGSGGTVASFSGLDFRIPPR